MVQTRKMAAAKAQAGNADAIQLVGTQAPTPTVTAAPPERPLKEKTPTKKKGTSETKQSRGSGDVDTESSSNKSGDKPKGKKALTTKDSKSVTREAKQSTKNRKAKDSTPSKKHGGGPSTPNPEEANDGAINNDALNEDALNHDPSIEDAANAIVPTTNTTRSKRPNTAIHTGDTTDSEPPPPDKKKRANNTGAPTANTTRPKCPNIAIHTGDTTDSEPPPPNKKKRVNPPPKKKAPRPRTRASRVPRTTKAMRELEENLSFNERETIRKARLNKAKADFGFGYGKYPATRNGPIGNTNRENREDLRRMAMGDGFGDGNANGRPGEDEEDGDGDVHDGGDEAEVASKSKGKQLAKSTKGPSLKVGAETKRGTKRKRGTENGNEPESRSKGVGKRATKWPKGKAKESDKPEDERVHESGDEAGNDG